MDDRPHPDGSHPERWRLLTAEILYHRPDDPELLGSFIWQELDLAPEFPALHRFLAFWEREIEGRLHSVRVGSQLVLGTAERRLLPAAITTQ